MASETGSTVQCRSALHITVESILIVLGITIVLGIGVAQCEETITARFTLHVRFFFQIPIPIFVQSELEYESEQCAIQPIQLYNPLNLKEESDSETKNRTVSGNTAVT